MTRGVRNCNPLNLRHGEKWQGLCNCQSDKQFCQFVSMQYGVRAAIIVIRTYFCVYHLRSVRDIIYRFAPSSENDTSSYVRLVSDDLRIDPDMNLHLDFYDFSHTSVLYLLLRSMARIESRFELSIDLFRESLSLVGEPQHQEYNRFLRLRNRLCATDPF